MLNLRNQRGSITLFVLVSCMFFVAAVASVQIYMQSKKTAVDREYRQIKSNYEGDIFNDENVLKEEYGKLSKINNVSMNVVKISHKMNDLRVEFNFNDTNLDVKTIKYGWGTGTTVDTVTNWSFIEKTGANGNMIALDQDAKTSGIYNLFVEVNGKVIYSKINTTTWTKSTPDSATGQVAGTLIKNPDNYGIDANAQATADGEGKYFAKPIGATYVEGTVDTGVVVNIKNSEFVWVPVEDAVLDTSKTANLPTSETNGTSSGKTYTPMAVKIGSDYKGLLYAFSENNAFLIFGTKENYYGGESDYREPDVTTYDGTDSDTVDGKITKEKLKTEYNTMIASVLKYKGFYVARYEAGLDKTTKEIVFKDASIEENNTITTDSTNTETSSWYGLYKKIKTFTTDSDKVVSNMIWGSQYDAMMNWMAKTGNIVGKADETKRNDNANRITGSSKNDRINNVFDLYGCHFEWTMENDVTDIRIYRGGSTAFDSPPTGYNGLRKPIDTYDFLSARATLYIK